MALDKGGLDYTIKVTDESPETLQQFRENLRLVKAEWRSLKEELRSSSRGRSALADELDRTAVAAKKAAQEIARQAIAERNAARDVGRRARAVEDANKAFDKKIRAEELARRTAERSFATERKLASEILQRQRAEEAITKTLEKRQRAEAIIAAARARNIQLTDKEAKSLGLLSAEQERLLKAKERLAAVKGAADPELQRINAETEALRRQNKVRQEALTQAALAAKGLTPTGTAQAPKDTGIKGRIKDLLGLNQAMDDADRKATRTGFTFRRLFGIFAAFTVVREAARSFRDLVVEMVRANAEVERATLGLTAQIGAVADIRDAQGELVGVAERFAIAEKEARKQVQLLRIDALQAGVAFEGLLEAFTEAIGPGLQAGFDLDQIRAFTKQISVAAKTIGVTGTQLAEEVRSILSGNINPRNTRVAQALGITNEDIRQAKEAGTLFDFLTQKFEIYTVAAARAADTWDGLVIKFKDGMKLIIASGGIKFFTALKSLLSEVVRGFVTLNKETGQIDLNPALVQVVETIGEGLTFAVQEAKELIEQVSSEDILNIARGFSLLLKVAASTLGELIQGAASGLSFISTVFQSIFDGFKNITGIELFDNAGLRATLQIIGAIAAMVLAIQLVWVAVIPIVKAANLALTGVWLTVKLITISAKLGAASFVALRTAIVASGAAMSAMAVTALALVAALTAIGLVVTQLTGLLDLQNTAIGTFGGDLILRLQAFGKRFRDEIELGAAPAAELYRQRLDEINKVLRSNIASQESFGDAFDKMWDKITNKTGKAVKQIVGDIQGVLTNVDPTGTILAQSEAIKELRDKIKQLTDDAKRARDDARGAIAAIGLPPQVAQQQQTFTKAIVDGLRETNKLKAEAATTARLILERERKLVEFQNMLLEGSVEYKAVEAEIAALNGRQAEIMDNIRKAKGLILDIAAAELEAQTQITNEELRRQNALDGIEAAHARNIRIFELEGNARGFAIEQAKKELEIQQQNNSEFESSMQLALTANKQQIDALTQQRDLLLEKQALEGLSPNETEALETATATVDSLEDQKTLLEQQLEVQRQIKAEETERLRNNLQLQEIIAEAPIGAGIVEGLKQAFDEVSDGFKTTVEIMKGTVASFASFISQSIVSAFDPTDDTTIEERFARFLQGLATQILTTLITLAVTAIALNAASGGLLGPLLQGFAVTRGANLGGMVGAIGRHEGGRAGRDHRRRGVFARASGYAGGGRPGRRKEHGVYRPSGLHPRDTVPIWADPSEWIIRGASVLKAGADAIERINLGQFDPSALRNAVGLDSFRRTVQFAAQGPGFASGGPAAAAQAAEQASLASASQDNNRLLGAFISANDEQTERMLRGGRNGMLRVLADNGIRPNSR